MPVFFAHSLEWRPRSGLRASQRLARTKSMRSALTTSLELVPVIHPVDVKDMQLATELFRRYGPSSELRDSPPANQFRVCPDYMNSVTDNVGDKPRLHGKSRLSSCHTLCAMLSSYTHVTVSLAGLVPPGTGYLFLPSRLGNPNLEEFTLASVTFSMRHFEGLTRFWKISILVMLIRKRFRKEVIG